MADTDRVKEGADFSMTIYHKPGPVTLPAGNWERVGGVELPSGYQGEVYVDDIAKRVYVGNAGTNDFSDVKAWPDVLLGPRSQQFRDMLIFAKSINEELLAGGRFEGYTIDTTGHSLGETFAQVQTYVFGWRGTGYDGPGAKLIVNDLRFAQMLQEQNLIALKGTDFIHSNTGGIGPLGGGVVGYLGVHISGTRECTVTLPSSTASGIVNWLFAITGVLVLPAKLVIGILLHAMKGINEAVQSGNFECAPVPGIIPKPQPHSSILEPFAIDDGEGNMFATVTDSSGQVVTDAGGQPMFSLTMNAGSTTQVAFLVDSSGLVTQASALQLNQNDPITDSFTLITRTTDADLSRLDVPTEGENASLVAGGTVLGGPLGIVQVAYNEPDALNNNTADNTAPAAATRILADDERPGNNNLALDVIDSFTLDLFSEVDFSFDVSPELIAATIDNAAIDARFSIPTDPLVLDLNGDGVTLTNYTEQPVLFDIDHDEALEQTGWVSAPDGLVVRDLNGDGLINHSGEMLSEYYTGAAGTGGNSGSKPFANGFGALASLDSNHDGKFDGADAAFSQLRVWVDGNSDGKTDAGELKTFAQLSITQINLTNTAQSGEVRDGNEVLASGTFVQSGQTKEALAANFLANPNGHIFTGNGNGTLISTQGGVTSYVTHLLTGELIDVGAKGVKNAYGGPGNDTLIGDAGNNWLAGGPGSDMFTAGAGDDVLLIDANDLQANIHAGAGMDIAQVVGDAGVTLNLTLAEVEIAQGGRGSDILIGAGRSSVFIRGGDGDDVIIGGAANDALSGEDGNDLVDGAAGNDLIRGHRGRDLLLGGVGDDIVDGGQDDDELRGGDGNDVLVGGQGDDRIDGGAGTDIAEYHGSYADYRITRTDRGLWVADTKSGRDGTDFLSGVEKLNFADVSAVSLNLPNPMPVKDVIAVPFAQGSGTPYLITKDKLVANDIDYQGDALHITGVSDSVGGTAVLTGQGDVLVTPDPTHTGLMGFKYTVADSQNNSGAAVNLIGTGESAEMKAVVFLRTTNMPTDPLVTDQWYLADTNVLPVWKDYTGQGVRIGQFEPGGDFAVTKEVLDYRQPDLAPNINPTWLANATLGQLAGEGSEGNFSTHATLVAGVMVAANNGEGAVGVAYGATIGGHWIGALPGNNPLDVSALARFIDYDVANNSWGFVQAFAPANIEGDYVNAIRYGRGSLGTVVVTAGGNDRSTGGNANYDRFSNNRYSIQVGAINATGDLGALIVAEAPFSNPGASILVSAPGSNVTSTARLLYNHNGSMFGNDNATAQGTSFATPIVSGVVALILQANPNLGYRDVQEILAVSSQKVVDPNTTWMENHATAWNGGKMHVSQDYGFGQVDAKAAVRLAETWTSQNTINNELGTSQVSALLSQAILDGNASGMTNTLTMNAGIVVEHAEVTVNLTHQRAGDLIIKLISPTGTESVLVNRPGKAPGSDATDRGDVDFAGSNTLNFAFTTTHDWGEASGGDWKLHVIDAATGNTGTLNSWSLKLYGKAQDSDNTYLYTNEYAALVASDSSRTVLNDTNGGRDTINAAAVDGNNSVNLTTGAASLKGAILTVQNAGTIENIFTGDGNDALVGNDANNLLSSGRGNNTLTGGAGLDAFVVRKREGGLDTVTDFSTMSGDTIILVGFVGRHFSDLSLTQQGTNTFINLGGGQSVLLQQTIASTLNSSHFEFQDQFAAPLPYVDSSATWTTTPPGGTITGTINADLLTGTTQGETLLGLGGNDEIHAGAGDDVLDGGTGSDNLYGEAGNDTIYLDGDAADFTFSGTGVVFTVGVMAGGTGSDRFVVRTTTTGNFSNIITDFELANPNEKIDLSQIGIHSFADLSYTQTTLNSTTMVSIKVPGKNVATLLGYTKSQISPSNFIFANPPSTSDDPGGGAGNSGPGVTVSGNTLTGNAGGNVLDGGTGPQEMAGRTGDDTYVVDNVGDAVIELSGGGFDTVKSSISYTLGADLENLVLAGAGNINGTGNAVNNRITGTSGNNILDGGAGPDTLIAGAGDDVYVVDNGSDSIIEQAGGGEDTVQSAVSYTLGSDVENLTLIGTEEINATGNALNNILTGNTANNTLDGAGGADSMRGGAGDDTYLVDTGNDVVTELADEGNDTVYAGITYTLGSDVDNLILSGSAAINGTGNGLDNRISGNSSNNVLTGGAGNDRLDGGAGTDHMNGGTGDDTYVIDAPDIVTEAASEGIDTVESAINYGLGANVENLRLTGTESINGTGNGLNNILIGNSANNVLTGGAGDDRLDGGAGTDHMNGGTGDDTYVIDAPDIVTEAASEGIDTVESAINCGLGANVENLKLTGTGSINGTGNVLSNVLTGNTSANVLDGGGGNDTITGRAGIDVLIGGAGDDSYAFNLGDGIDTIHDSATATEGNRILFGAGITAADLIFTRGQNTMTIAYDTFGDALHLADFDPSNVTGSLVVKTLQFSDGMSVNLADLLNVNHAPTVAHPVADQSTAANTAFSLVVPVNTFTDVNQGDTLTYSAVLSDGQALPAWLGFNPTSLTFSGSPHITDAGSISVKLTATDAGNLTASDIFALTVTNVTTLPTLLLSYGGKLRDKVGQGDLVLSGDGAADGTFTLTLGAGSGNHILSALNLRRTDGSGTWDTLQGGPGYWALGVTSSLDGALVNGADSRVSVPLTGSSSITLFASDLNNIEFVPGASFILTATFADGTSATTTTTAGGGAHAPTVANPIADRSTLQDAQFSFQVPANTFADADPGDTLTYSASLANGSPLPAWLGFNAATRAFSGIPHSTDEGNISVKLTATDTANLSATDIFGLTVTKVIAPAALTLSYGGKLRDKVGQGDLVLSGDGAADGTFTLTMGAGSGNHTLTALNLRRTDGSGTWDTLPGGPGYWALGVSSGLDGALLNDPDSRVNVPLTEGGSVTLFASDLNNIEFVTGASFILAATFADGSSATTTMTVGGSPPSPAVTLGYVGKLRDKVGQGDLVLSGDGATDGTFTLTLGAGSGNHTLTGLNLRRADGSGTWDTLPGGPGYWALGVSSGLDGALVNGADSRINVPLTESGSVTLFASDLNNIEFVPGASFILAATFADGTSATSTMTVVVGAHAPTVANPIADRSTLQDAQFSFQVPANTFADADPGDTLTYSASLANGSALPAWLTFDLTAHTLTGTPGAGDVGNLNLTVTVRDSGGLSVADTFGLTVTPAQLNVILGTDSNDVISGTTGDDAIDGKGGNDTLRGRDGADVLTGGPGDDLLYGEGGNDSLDGGAGHDVIYGEQGNDTLSGGDGVDYLYGSDGADILTGGTGDDLLYGEGGNDSLVGGAGHDVLYGAEGNDTLNGADGVDYLYGSDGADTLMGGAANDVLYGEAGNDTYVFNLGDGADMIYDTAGASEVNRIVFGPGIDPNALTFTGTQQLLTITVGSGGDQLMVLNSDPNLNNGPLVVSTLQFSDGTEHNLVDLLPPSVTTGGKPGQVLRGRDGADVLTGGAGDDLLYGEAGNDSLDGGAGDDVLYGEGGNDSLVSGAGHDVLYGAEGNDMLNGGDDVDYLYGGNGADILTGGAGDDLLYAETGDDTLSGGDGADYLIGEDGADILMGGAGDDHMSGGVGNDTYVFNLGDGVDTIQDIVTASEGNRIVFGPGIDPSALTFTRTQDSVLTIRVGSGGDELSLRNFDPNQRSGSLVVSTLQFSDGTEHSLLELYSQSGITGTEGNDVLRGTSGDDAIRGLGGDDVLYGERGNDSQDGGTGHDVLYGEEGNDSLDGGAGDDLLYGDAGDDRLDGGAGHDLLYGAEGNDTLSGGDDVDYLYGSDGADILTGGAGDDLLYGETGADTLSGGNGADVLHGGDGADVLTGGSGEDLLYGEAGNDSQVGGAGNDTYWFNRGSEQDTIVDQDATGGNSDTVAFGAGIMPLDLILSRQADTLRIAIHGSSDQVTIQNWYSGPANQAETIQAGDGRQLLNTQVDQLIQAMASFGAQTGLSWDQAIDQRPQDVQRILAANWHNKTETGTTLIGTDSNDKLSGTNGEDAIDAKGGNDRVFGRDGADVLTGGAGDDWLYGEGGDDNLDGGAGNDVLYGNNYGEEGNDTLSGGDGADSLFAGEGADLLVGGAGDDELWGEGGDDTLNGGDGADYLTGGDGADVLTGGAGNDELYGRAGNDGLDSGGGNDTYMFEGSFGQDTITDLDAIAGNSDTVAFGFGITPLDLILSRQVDNLRIAIHGSSDQVTIQNWYGGSANQAETILAGDGQQLLNTQVDQLIQAMASFGAQTGLSWDQAVDQRPQDVQTILAASWQ